MDPPPLLLHKVQDPACFVPIAAGPPEAQEHQIYEMAHQKLCRKLPSFQSSTSKVSPNITLPDSPTLKCVQTQKLNLVLKGKAFQLVCCYPENNKD